MTLWVCFHNSPSEKKRWAVDPQKKWRDMGKWPKVIGVTGVTRLIGVITPGYNWQGAHLVPCSYFCARTVW